MNTPYYKVMPIDVLPEESGHEVYKGDKYIGWLKPITLTLQELLQTEEGKEIIREVFNAAREETVYSDTSCGRGIGGQLMTSKPSYPTADDFINNN
jgi:hypothetical protein